MRCSSNRGKTWKILLNYIKLYTRRAEDKQDRRQKREEKGDGKGEGQQDKE
jgi:hypothetical protein